MYNPTLISQHMEDALIIANGLRGSYGKHRGVYMVNKAFVSALDRESLCWYLPHVSFCVDWEKLMATKNSDYNLIDYRLTDQELAEFDTWLAKQAGDPTQVLTELASSDYKISLTYVETSEAWCISVTGKEGQKFNAKSTLTTWADEPLEGIYMAFFKVFNVFKGGKWVTKAQSRRG